MKKRIQGDNGWKVESVDESMVGLSSATFGAAALASELAVCAVTYPADPARTKRFIALLHMEALQIAGQHTHIQIVSHPELARQKDPAQMLNMLCEGVTKASFPDLYRLPRPLNPTSKKGNSPGFQPFAR